MEWTRGIVYIAYGKAAIKEATFSLKSLRSHCQLPVSVIGGELSGANFVKFKSPYKSNEQASRWAKMNLAELTPYDQTLYLDADTRIVGDLSVGFEILEDGWPLVIAPSGNQDQWIMAHMPGSERTYTLDYLFNKCPLQLQAGVFYFDRLKAMPFFATWRLEWKRFEDQDQGALLRALSIMPIPIWVLGEVWNRSKGEVIDHLFGGRARGRSSHQVRPEAIRPNKRR